MAQTLDDVRRNGERIRRQVLGDAHVERSHQSANDYNRDLVDLVERYCWGEIWSRPKLDRRTRSLINIAMLTALNRSDELALHLRGSRANGVSDEEIAEVILQSAIYCGVPAALDAARVAHQQLGVTD